MPAIPAFGRYRQEAQKFKTIFGKRVSLKPARVMPDPVSIKIKTKAMLVCQVFIYLFFNVFFLFSMKLRLALDL